MPKSTYIVCEDSPLAMQFRQHLVRCGCECPISNVLSLDTAARGLEISTVRPTLIFVLLSAASANNLEPLQQLRERTKARLVAVGPTHDSSIILRAVHAGADDFLDANDDLPAQLGRCLQRLRRKEQSTAGAGRLIAVTAPCGGSGASVIAGNLAAILCQRQPGSVLVDLDVHRGDQAGLFNLSPRHTLADLWRNSGSLDAKMLEQSLTAHESGVRLLAAPDDLQEAAKIDRACLQQVLELSRTAFPLTVVDFPTTLDDGSARLLSLCDDIVLAFRLDFTSLRNLRRLLSHFEHLDLDTRKIHLVANRSGLPKELSASKFRAALQHDVRLSIEDDPQLVTLSVNCGTPAVLESPHSPLAESIRQLANLFVESPATAATSSGNSSSIFRYLRGRLTTGESPAATKQKSAIEV